MSVTSIVQNKHSVDVAFEHNKTNYKVHLDVNLNLQKLSYIKFTGPIIGYTDYEGLTNRIFDLAEIGKPDPNLWEAVRDGLMENFPPIVQFPT